MDHFADTTIHIGPIGNSRWVALTLVSPYLCFEAESRDALLEKCKQALSFCKKAATELEKRGRPIQPFRATETILARELENA